MESSSQPYQVTRRRALHFNIDTTSTNDRPLVTRPGRSRGHLHRVDPYTSAARDEHASISKANSNADPSSLAALVQQSERPDTHRNKNAENASTDDAEGSLAGSSYSSSASFNTGSMNSSSASSSDSVTSTQTKKKAVTVTRSISWANAINAGHFASQDYFESSSGGDLAYSPVGRGISSPAISVQPGIGVGIGSINHHHPLQKDVLPITSQTTPSSNINTLIQKKGLSGAVQYTLRLQSRRLSSAFTNQKLFGKNFSNVHRLMIFALPFALIVFSGAGKVAVHHSAKKLDQITKSAGFDWSPGRRLKNRKCVLNMFIEKQEPDEFNPDFEIIKPGEKNKDGTPKVRSPLKLEPGTYRTKGQVKLILRLISSVADSFRPILNVQQHLVFAGSRDGGHLADEALKQWPPRGKYQTKLFVIADNEDAPTLLGRDQSDRALSYGPIDAIEQRFQNHAKSENIHIFDNSGQKAGLLNSLVDDDDVAITMEEEMFHVEDDEFRADLSSVDDEVVLESKKQDRTKRRTEKENGEDMESADQEAASFFSLKKLMQPYLERGNDDSQLLSSSVKVNRTDHVIPYLHVDGTSAAQQFAILRSATPLLLDGTVAIVGVENPGDMNVNDLIDFFHSVKYKTFLLGKRQVMRIDHLCDEILDQVMNHPFITPKKPGYVRTILEKLGLTPKDHHVHMKHPHPEHDMLYPPFFVAFPRGRAEFEEMTIQHMYDLFGGGGGGGQIATANDRKAPTKKKQST